MPTTPPADTPLMHSAFYRFVPVADPAALATQLRTLGAQCAGLGGSIVLAAEGLNAAIAGPADAIARFEAALQQADVLGGALRGLVFKHSTCRSHPFGRLKVQVKPEIVALGLPQAQGHKLPPPDEHDSSHLSPAAWRALMAQVQAGRAVLLDNRNHFEFRAGHFRGAVDPQVNNFRDFVAWVQAQAPAWREAGTPVAMYCTGGIRCDKTAPWLRSLGLQVWQLDGGVLNYFQQLPDAQQDWQGECFVFDRRITLDTQLRETGRQASEVYDPQLSDEAWRLARALRLDEAAAG